MTRDLSHEEERKSEWGKIACRERQKIQRKNEKHGREEKNEEDKEKVSVGGERYITATIMSLTLTLVIFLEVIVKFVDLLRKASAKTF